MTEKQRTLKNNDTNIIFVMVSSSMCGPALWRSGGEHCAVCNMIQCGRFGGGS